MTPEQQIAVMEARGATVKVNQRKDGSYRVAMIGRYETAKNAMTVADLKDE